MPATCAISSTNFVQPKRPSGPAARRTRRAKTLSRNSGATDTCNADDYSNRTTEDRDCGPCGPRKVHVCGAAFSRHGLAAGGQTGAIAEGGRAARRAVRVGQSDGCLAVRTGPEYHDRYSPNLVSHEEAAVRQ